MPLDLIQNVVTVQEYMYKVKSLTLPLFRKEDVKCKFYSFLHFLWKLKYLQKIVRLLTFLVWAYSW